MPCHSPLVVRSAPPGRTYCSFCPFTLECEGRNNDPIPANQTNHPVSWNVLVLNCVWPWFELDFWTRIANNTFYCWCCCVRGRDEGRKILNPNIWQVEKINLNLPTRETYRQSHPAGQHNRVYRQRINRDEGAEDTGIYSALSRRRLGLFNPSSSPQLAQLALW